MEICNLAVVICLSTLAACAPYFQRYAPAADAFETGYYDDIKTARLALLEYRLADYFALGRRPYAVVCAAAGNIVPHVADSQPRPLDPDVERAFISRFPELSPLSRCQRRGLDIVAADTEQVAAIFDVNEFSCEALTNCLGWAGYYANGQHGWRSYRMRYRGGEWRIMAEPSDIVLTGESAA